MRIEKNLLLGTAQEIGDYVAEKVHSLGNYKKWKEFFEPPVNFAMNFAIADIFDNSLTLEEIHIESKGWYGIKAINSGHDSNDIALIGDYYGGGSATLFSIYELMTKEEIADGWIVNPFLYNILSNYYP